MAAVASLAGHQVRSLGVVDNQCLPLTACSSKTRLGYEMMFVVNRPMRIAKTQSCFLA